MKAVAQAIRIYGSQDQYGTSPREAAREDPFEARDFPERGDRCRVYLGAVPERTREILRRRDAVATALLQVGFGLSGHDFEATVDSQLATSNLQFEAHNWYVTLTLERPILLSQEDLVGEGHGWVNPLALEEADEKLREDAPGAFLALVTLMAPIIGTAFFRERVVPDRFAVVDETDRPMIFPRLTGSASISVGKPIESLDIETLDDRLKHADGVWRTNLKRALEWQLAMLETADPWKQFQWGFLGLEVLTHKLFDRLRPPALAGMTMTGATGVQAPQAVIEAMLWEQQRCPLAARFALVAGYLLPSSAETDYKTFRALLEVRNRTAHGSATAPEDLPVSEVRELFIRFLDAAVTSLSNDETSGLK